MKLRLKRTLWGFRYKLQRWWDTRRAPWPIVGECHKSHVEGHYCEQCAPRHGHEWAPWPNPPKWVAYYGTPIRCIHCGARKCDMDGCNERRHDHTHKDGMALPIIFTNKRPPLPSERHYS